MRQAQWVATMTSNPGKLKSRIVFVTTLVFGLILIAIGLMGFWSIGELFNSTRGSTDPGLPVGELPRLGALAIISSFTLPGFLLIRKCVKQFELRHKARE